MFEAILEVAKLMAAFTPTDKDDKAIEDFENFLDEHPILAAEIMKLFFKILRTKSQ